MKTRLFALVAAGLTAGAIIAYVTLPNSSINTTAPADSSGTKVTGTALVGGPFALTDQTGKRVTEKDFLGKYMLVFFGFTNCPDICPSGLQVVSAALDKLGTKADDITPVFVTLDAKRDTPEKLAAYVKSFHPRLVGLTGSEDDVAAAAKAYRVYFQKIVDEKTPDSYSYDHAALFYLMGKDGAFVAPIPHTTDVNEVVAALDKAVR
ncbi:MAG: SCO family protein [Hyphomicrobium sp.]|nr:MAG: SCO family protein [Hyphomicrobium sp.]PPC98737.1 MAG: SCO family protein [Hyphomicrobium sp.]